MEVVEVVVEEVEVEVEEVEGAGGRAAAHLVHLVHQHFLLVEHERLVVAEAVVVVVAVVPRQQPLLLPVRPVGRRAARPRRLVLREAAVAEGAQRARRPRVDDRLRPHPVLGDPPPRMDAPLGRFDLRDLERVGELGRLAVGTRRLQERGSGGGEVEVVVVVGWR